MPDNRSILAKTARLFLIISLTCLIMYFGKVLFIPMFYGLFIAIVLYPLSRWLEKRGWPRSAAVGLGLTIVVILFALLVTLVVVQINALRSDLPLLQEKIQPAIVQLNQWIATNLDISVQKQDQWWTNAMNRLTANSGSLLAGTFSTTAALLFNLFIIPVFAALFLYNRYDFILFLEKISGHEYRDRLHAILHKTIHTYAQFIKGMILVYLIVGVLNSIGLLALGIRHAILFGFLTAIMTIIPYIGIFVSAMLPISMALITKDSVWYAVGVVGVFSFVQYLEANVIFPKVVAAELNVSTWATLVAIIAGGIIWGVSGMILFIPFVGMLKMVTDFIPEWEALNVLLRRKPNA